jgi:hypothetical protein
MSVLVLCVRVSNSDYPTLLGIALPRLCLRLQCDVFRIDNQQCIGGSPWADQRHRKTPFMEI